MAPAGPRLVVIRDAETETLLRNFATPLFRAAGLDANLVRIVVIRDDAINSFVSTGNRVFIQTGLLQQAASASQLVGVIAPETGHAYGGHLPKLPVQLHEAMLESVAALLIGTPPAWRRMLDGLIAEQRNNPFLYEMQAQVLFEGGRVRDAIAPYQAAVRLAPGQPLLQQGLVQGDVAAAHRFAQNAEHALPPGPGRLRAWDIGNAVGPENRLGDEP